MNWNVAMLKELLGISTDDFSNDIPLQFTMGNIEEIVKNYCNISCIPDGLTATCHRMVIDLYRAAGLGEEDVPLLVSSIKEGDTSTSFGSRISLLSGSILNNYKAQLNRYRKLRW